MSVRALLVVAVLAIVATMHPVEAHHSFAAEFDRDKPMTLKMASSGPSRAVFEAEKDEGDLAGVRYEVEGEVLKIVVSFTQAEREPLEFALKRK